MAENSTETRVCDSAITLAFSVLGKRWNGMIIDALRVRDADHAGEIPFTDFDFAHIATGRYIQPGFIGYMPYHQSNTHGWIGLPRYSVFAIFSRMLKYPDRRLRFFGPNHG